MGSLLFSCFHPGILHTLALLNRHFWWSSVHRDVEEYVAACPVCGRAKSNSQRPQGLLQPLLVPHRPWSHIAIDFVTSLPEFQGHSVILTIVDIFSKSAHFVPLPKLPSSRETAQILIQHIMGFPSRLLQTGVRSSPAPSGRHSAPW